MTVTPRQARVVALREQFLTLSWLAFRQMVQRVQVHGITHPQFITLASLTAYGQPATMRQLSEVTMQDGPTMTGIVDRLVKMKLARRTRREEDRRIVWVEATPAAITLIEEIRLDLDQNDSQGFHRLTDEQLTRMEEILEYSLRLYLQNIHQLGPAELAAQREKLRIFAGNPLAFIEEMEHVNETEHVV